MVFLYRLLGYVYFGILLYMKHDQQSSVRRFFASRSFLIFVIILLASFAFGFARAYFQDYKVRQEIRQLESEVKQLENKKIKSMEILNYVASDRYVEDTARTEMNLKKPGEHVLFIENDENTQGAERQFDQESTDGQNISNPLKWVYYFIHKKIPGNGT